MRAPLVAWAVLCLVLGCWTVLAQEVDPGDNKTQWEDRPRYFTRAFDVNVGGGTTFSVSTVTTFEEEDFSTAISISSSRNAWIGLMVGTRMVRSKAIIALNPANNPGLQPVNLYNLVSQTGIADRDCVPIDDGLAQNGISDASFEVVDGRTVLNFTITQSAAQGFPLLGNAPGASVTVSFVTGNQQALDYHLSYTFQSVSFSVTEDGAAPIDTEKVLVEISFALAYHIALMIVAWLFLLPCGAMCALARVRRGPNATGRWFKYHRGIQMLGVALGFGGWVVGIIHLNDFGTPHLSKGHHNIGYAVGMLSLVQVVNGLMRPHAPQNGESPTKERSRWFLSHRTLGSALLLLGIINCVVGANIVQEILGGGETIVVFPGTSGIAAKDLYLLVLVLGILGLVVLFAGSFIDCCRRRREMRQGNADYSFQPQMDQPKQAAYEPPSQGMSAAPAYMQQQRQPPAWGMSGNGGGRSYDSPGDSAGYADPYGRGGAPDDRTRGRAGYERRVGDDDGHGGGAGQMGRSPPPPMMANNPGYQKQQPPPPPMRPMMNDNPPAPSSSYSDYPPPPPRQQQQQKPRNRMNNDDQQYADYPPPPPMQQQQQPRNRANDKNNNPPPYSDYPPPPPSMQQQPQASRERYDQGRPGFGYNGTTPEPNAGFDMPSYGAAGRQMNPPLPPRSGPGGNQPPPVAPRRNQPQQPRMMMPPPSQGGYPPRQQSPPPPMYGSYYAEEDDEPQQQSYAQPPARSPMRPPKPPIGF